MHKRSSRKMPRPTAGVVARHRAFLAVLSHGCRGETGVTRVAQVLRRVHARTAFIGVALSFPRSIAHMRAWSAPAPAVAVRRNALGRPAFANVTRRYCSTVVREGLIRTLEHVVVRLRRDERQQLVSALASSVLPVDGATLRAAFPRVPLTLVRRPAAPGSAIAETAPVAPSAGARGTHPLGLERRAISAALPPDELSRITEHVLRTLDRRVLSHHERTGQM